MNLTLSNTNGYKVMQGDEIKIEFDTLEQLNDWIMRNGKILSNEEIDKFYGWAAESDHG